MNILINIIALMLFSCSKAGFKNNIKMDEVASKGPEGYTGTDEEIRKQIAIDIWILTDDYVNKKKNKLSKEEMLKKQKKAATNLFHTEYKHAILLADVNKKGVKIGGIPAIYEAVKRNSPKAFYLLFNILKNGEYTFNQKVKISEGNEYNLAQYIKHISKKYYPTLAQDILFYSIDISYLPVIEFLITNNLVDINKDFNGEFFPLLLAALNVANNDYNKKSINILKYLLSVDGIDKHKRNSGSTSVILFALANKQFSLFEILIEGGCDMFHEYKYEDGVTTSLFTLIYKNCREAVDYLFDHYPDIIDKPTSIGFTPLMYAIEYEKYDIAKLILEKKEINVNAQDEDGNTGLIIAAAKGNLEIMKMLVDRGANIDLQNKNGDTSLMFAASDGHERIVEYLVEKGANIGIKNSVGNTAVFLAFIKGNVKCVSFLNEKGA